MALTTPIKLYTDGLEDGAYDALTNAAAAVEAMPAKGTGEDFQAVVVQALRVWASRAKATS